MACIKYLCLFLWMNNALKNQVCVSRFLVSKKWISHFTRKVALLQVYVHSNFQISTINVVHVDSKVSLIQNLGWIGKRLLWWQNYACTFVLKLKDTKVPYMRQLISMVILKVAPSPFERFCAPKLYVIVWEEIMHALQPCILRKPCQFHAYIKSCNQLAMPSHFMREIMLA